MIRVLPEVVEPTRWIVCFHRTASRRWLGWLAAGRYKHVSAIAWLAPLELWLVYELGLGGTRIVALPDGPGATRRLAEFTADADLVEMPVRTRVAVPLAPLTCVSAVRHLIGLRTSALRPDALWRDCLRNGGTVVHGSEQTARAGD